MSAKRSRASGGPELAFDEELPVGAAQLVVYEDVCVTTTVADTAPPASTSPAASAPTLASTGSSDGLVLGTASGLLLLVGAVSLMLARRRSA